MTSDFGLILLGKAKRQGLEVFKLPNSYKLTEEPDPNEKKIADLQTELRKITDNLPKVSLIFENGENHVKYPLEQQKPAITDNDIEKLLSEIKREHPKVKNDNKPMGSDLALQNYMNTVSQITKADIETYV